MVKPLFWYLVFTFFNPDMVSDFPLLLHAWTDLKSIFLDSMCRKMLPFKNTKSVASSTCWWCLAIRGGKGILGMVLWCYRILLIALPCMVGIWWPYMASALLMSSVVIVQFLIWFFWMDYLKVCVEGYPTSCCNILALSNPLIYFLWKHDLLLSTVLRNVSSVVWSSEKASFFVSK